VTLVSDAAVRLIVRRVGTRTPVQASPTARYLVVGLICTGLDFTIFNLLAFRFGFPKSSSKILATGLAIVVSFLLNRGWTFRGSKSAKWERQFALYVAVNVASTLLSVVCMRLAVADGLTGQLWANVAAFGVVLTVGTAARFLIYRRFVFR
jgi:putative flippase GtrA